MPRLPVQPETLPTVYGWGVYSNPCNVWFELSTEILLGSAGIMTEVQTSHPSPLG